MATKGDVKQAVYDECRVVLNDVENLATPHGRSFTSLSNVDDHLDVARGRDDAVYPSIAFEEFGRVRSTGMGNHVYVDETTYVNGSLDSLTFRKDERLRFDIYAETDGNEGGKDALYTALKEQFEQFMELKAPSDLHGDVEDIELRDTRGADRNENGVRGDRLQLVVDFYRTRTYTDIPTMETIEMQFDVDSKGSVAEFTETVSN